MGPLVKLAAVGSAAAAAASAAAWLVIAARPQAPVAPPAASQSPGNDDVVVCVGSDAVLRELRSGEDCPAGTTRLALAAPDRKAEDETCDECDPWNTPDARPAAPPSGPLASLERRLAEMEKFPLFAVVDKDGDLVFSVAPERVVTYNKRQDAVATIHSTALGGFFTGRSADDKLTVSVGVSGANAGVRIQEAGVTRLDLGRQESGNYSLKVPSGDGVIAGIGESRAGTGALVVGDPEGRVRASMTVADGKGVVGVFDRSGTAVLSLTEGATGGGLFVIGDATGEPMAKMGVKARYGVVLTGPRAGFPLVPSSGLPGSYFLGCAGGDSCQK